MRIVAWNIRAGGGLRVAGIRDQLRRWSPDIVCLCEFRATPPSMQLAAWLADDGLEHQATTAVSTAANRNALLLASRWPLRRLALHRTPREPGRWLAAEIASQRPFTVGLMHVPNMVSGRKFIFLEALYGVATRWRRGPGLLVGDTNCGWPGIDEERPVFSPSTARWLDSMAEVGWRDAFRYLKPEERSYTWYSPNAGNGFRLDQAFVNRPMLPRLRDACYEWGRPEPCDETTRRDALSDHAALILDFD